MQSAIAALTTLTALLQKLAVRHRLRRRAVPTFIRRPRYRPLPSARKAARGGATR
jgi:hypothetical protein